MPRVLDEFDQATIRTLLAEQAKVCWRKSAWRRQRDSAKHFHIDLDAEGRTARAVL